MRGRNNQTFKQELGYALRALGDLLVPRRCLVCGEVLETRRGAPAEDTCLLHYLCPSCAEDLPETFFWGWRENPAEQQLWHRVGIVQAASLYFYRQGSDYTRLLQAVKYEANLPLGRALGRELGRRMRESGRFSQPVTDPVTGEVIPPFQAIVPVPLHPLRRWRRGYNQAEIISRGLAEGLADKRRSVCSGQTRRRLFSFARSKQSEAVVTDLLRRARYTRTQTKLSAEEKQRNVADAFVLQPKTVERLIARGVRHLLLVDDVMTTGATLSEAVKPLLAHFYVSVATIAFVE
ncbi:MAG: ComF family protein [Bacteroidales bacterium]|nr:ComF family protein [Bacteroidales bacterium]